ncbi:MAG TPA: hypothetical protein DEP53_05310, partial [Bacteroidetes bacterium]|nr:hypothetical protein [Bacteroidota bacterium]
MWQEAENRTAPGCSMEAYTTASMNAANRHRYDNSRTMEYRKMIHCAAFRCWVDSSSRQEPPHSIPIPADLHTADSIRTLEPQPNLCFGSFRCCECLPRDCGFRPKMVQSECLVSLS